MSNRILAYPFDSGPYQEQLYGEMRARGVRVSYLRGPTPSSVVNLVLSPLLLVAYRLRGYRVLHLHWVWPFWLPRSARGAFLPRIAQIFFARWLGWAKVLGFKIVWTAHNVLPHFPVFADDVAARRTLVAAADLIFVHSKAAANDLRDLTGINFEAVILPLGPYALDAAYITGDASLRRLLGMTDSGLLVCYFGVVRPYKGVDMLIQAFVEAAIEGSHLLVVGECPDASYRRELETLAATSATTVTLRLERVADAELASILNAASLVALPFRHVTTSGSVQLAATMGKPLLIPDLEAFASLPTGAALRYDGSISGLCGALVTASAMTATDLDRIGATAKRSTEVADWSVIANMSLLHISRLFRSTPDGVTIEPTDHLDVANSPLP